METERKPYKKPNRHHIMFNALYYSGHPDLLALREDDRSIIETDYYVHQDLHKEVSYVPPISIHLAEKAIRLYKAMPDYHDPIRNMEAIQRSIEKAHTPRTDQLEKSIAEYALHAIDLQKPFIREGATAYTGKRLIIAR